MAAGGVSGVSIWTLVIGNAFHGREYLKMKRSSKLQSMEFSSSCNSEAFISKLLFAHHVKRRLLLVRTALVYKYLFPSFMSIELFRIVHGKVYSCRLLARDYYMKI